MGTGRGDAAAALAMVHRIRAHAVVRIVSVL
jgi:hypothetical protein